MAAMFSGCSGLTSLDLSNFKTDKVTDMSRMFDICNELTTIYVSELWNLASVEKSVDMFSGDYKIVGGAGTRYNWKYTDASYARVDEGASKPGYLTYKAPSSTHVEAISPTTDVSVKWYNLEGRKVSKPQKGLYIMKGNDGKPRKVLLKSVR